MTELTGTATLVRFILRRDRVRIALWIAGIVALVLSTAAQVKSLYPTQAKLDDAADLAHDNPALLAWNGPDQALDTLGGEVAFNVGAFGLATVGLMSLFMIGRNTRGEEEGGRTELVRAAPVGRHAPATAGLLVVGGMNLVVGVLVTLSLMAMDLPTAGSLVFGASFTALGLAFAGVATVVAQVTENTRVVYGASGAIVGAAYALRAAGDVGDGTVSWLSPIGWAQKARPYAGEQWWPLLLLLVLAGGLVVVAAALAARRDIDAGLVPPRPGPPVASPLLSRPLGLALRLQRGSLIAWSAGLFVLGASYGSLGESIEEFVEDNESLEELLTQQSGASITDSFYATAMLILALISAGYAIQSAYRLRSEETGLRAEPLLATRVSRWQWVASHLTMAMAGSFVVLAAGGLGTGLLYGIVASDFGEVPNLLGAAVVYAPAMWLVVGITVALFGLFPRAVLAVWGALALWFVIGMFGELLELPSMVVDLSPFQHIPSLPATGMDVVPVAILTAIAAGLTAFGLATFRRRDLGVG
jgi:ABC-2 type transport system permease protein